ncbi:MULTISPECIES: TlpA disulfide reductase family protein [Pseudomonas]|uniref:TlpA family protein disulfide reductase n=1 Tax=Pseudomonas TaxID=286 RepID=UPI0013A71864|nr:TlpA disulfide reductase family protein [Pseudomonas sp. OIL-1]QIB51388.1 TlpA family protein disulfide reductase [Pseudomonas sp. OIL-1]
MINPVRKLLSLGLVLLLSACGGNSWQDQHGNSITEEELSGRPMLVNYWAEWCGPCRDELPELNALAEARPDVAVLGINFDGIDGDALTQLSDEMGIRFPVLGKDFADTMQLEHPQVLPTTYLLDEQGQVIRTLQGPQDEAALLAALSEADRAP